MVEEEGHLKKRWYLSCHKKHRSEKQHGGRREVQILMECKSKEENSKRSDAEEIVKY